MSDIGMLLITVCGGAFFWGVLLIVKKVYLDRHNTHEDVVVVSTLLGAATLCVFVEAVLLLTGETHISSAVWWPLLVTAIFNVGIQYWGVRALKLEDASIVGPLSATMPMWVVFLSGAILKEWPTAWGKVGITLIGLGAYMIRLEKGKVALPEWLQRMVSENHSERVAYFVGPWIRLSTSKGARLALLTALLGAVSVNFDKLAVLASSAMFHTSGTFLFVVVCVYSWSKIIGRWETLDRQMFRRLFMWGLLLGIANIMMNSGYYFGIVPYVSSLKRTHILWVVVLSGLFLKEKNIGMRLFAAMLIGLGAFATMF